MTWVDTSKDYLLMLQYYRLDGRFEAIVLCQNKHGIIPNIPGVVIFSYDYPNEHPFEDFLKHRDVYRSIAAQAKKDFRELVKENKLEAIILANKMK